jgi:hypothetical protein
MRIHLIALLSSDTTGYRLLLIGHLLCAIIGFGSTFVYPFMGAEAGKRKGVEGAAISDAVMKTASIVTAPFIYGAGIFGLLLVAFGPYDWGDRWLQIATAMSSCQWGHRRPARLVRRHRPWRSKSAERPQRVTAAFYTSRSR